MTLEKLPLRKGVIYDWNALLGHRLVSHHDGVTINSQNDSCFSISSGTVTSTFDLGGEYAVLIKTEENTFHTYAGFRSLAVQKNDLISKASFLGNLKREGDDYELLFMIADKKARYLSETLHLQYLQEANCEATQQNKSSFIFY